MKENPVINIRADQFDTLNGSLAELGRLSAEIALRMNDLVETQKKIEALHAQQVAFWNRNEKGIFNG